MDRFLQGLHSIVYICFCVYYHKNVVQATVDQQEGIKNKSMLGFSLHLAQLPSLPVWFEKTVNIL